MKNSEVLTVFVRFICRPLRGLERGWARFPRLGFAIAWGYHSARQLRRLMEWFLPTDHWFFQASGTTEQRLKMIEDAMRRRSNL
jgi:hypothetical protein